MAKILLVEDDNNLMEIYEARLQAEGYEIITAKDGEQALVVAKAEKPDLVISDIMMPKISGFEMLDILRNTDGLKDVRVIMLTALGQSDDQQRAGRLGADRYLVKSQVTLEDIVKVTHELLDDGAGDAALAADTTTASAGANADDSTAGAGAPDQPAMPATPAEPPAAAIPVAKPPADNPAPAAEPATSTTASDDTPPAPPPAATPAQTDDTSSTPSPATVAAEDDARSTDQEEASVEANIEDFVAGATTDAPAPASQPVLTDAVSTTTASASQVSPANPSQPATATADSSANDDKLMAQAVDNLIADAEPKAAGPATATAGATTVTVTPTMETPVKPEATTPTASTSGPVQVAHKKVITPIDSTPKTDLDKLLAVEAAKEAAAAPAGQTDSVVSSDDTPSPVPTLSAAAPSSVVTPETDEDAPSGGPAKPPTAAGGPAVNDPSDPSSIAL